MIKRRILVIGAAGKTDSVVVTKLRREHAIADQRFFLENRYDRYHHQCARAL